MNLENLESKFVLKRGVSKKGNKTVTVIQVPNEKYPYSREQGFSCSQKYKDIIKVKTVADADFFREYVEKTVEEVFDIAFSRQDWRLIPFNPITTSVTMKPISMPDWVHYNGDEND